MRLPIREHSDCDGLETMPKRLPRGPESGGPREDREAGNFSETPHLGTVGNANPVVPKWRSWKLTAPCGAAVKKLAGWKGEV